MPALAIGCTDAVVERDIVYDERFGAATSMDIYHPADSATERPTVLFIHGGAWRSGDKDHFRNMGPRLADSGFVAASINYRLVPDAGVFPRNIQDCLCAYAYLRAHASEWGIDTDRIALMGYSAGAHLASLVGTAADHPALAPDCAEATGQTLPLPAAVISGSGPQDANAMWDGLGDDMKWIAEDIFGGPPSQLADAYALGSPIEHVRPDAPPYLIIRDAFDSAGNGAMRDALVEQGVDAQLMEVAGSLHILEQHAEPGTYEGGVAIETPEAWIAIEDMLFRTIAKEGL